MKMSDPARISLMGTIVLVILVLAGCRDRGVTVELPETPVMTRGMRYGLILPAFATIHARPERTAEIVSHGRQSEVVEVVGRTPSGNWIEIETIDSHGWVRAEQVSTYASRDQALNAQGLLGR